MRRPSPITTTLPQTSPTRRGLRGAVVGLVLPAFTALSVGPGCAGGRLQLSAADGSNSNSGNSDGSKGSSDGSNGSGNSGNSGDASKDSGESKSSSRDGRSSDSRSETSNTVTTKGNPDNPDQANSAGLLILTGALLLGATTLGIVWYLNVEDPKEHVAKHEREIRLALARGEGVFFRDVAGRLGATEVEIPRVARALRAGRARLEAFLGEGEITTEMGQGFALAVADLLRQDEVLKPRVDALMQQIERARTAPTASTRG